MIERKILIFANMEDCVKYFINVIMNLENKKSNVKRIYEYNIVTFLDKIKTRNYDSENIVDTVYIKNYDCFYIISLLKNNRFKVEKVQIDDDFTCTIFERDVKYYDDMYNVLLYCHY